LKYLNLFLNRPVAECTVIFLRFLLAIKVLLIRLGHKEVFPLF